jgi:hypothetical protein
MSKNSLRKAWQRSLPSKKVLTKYCRRVMSNQQNNNSWKNEQKMRDCAKICHVCPSLGQAAGSQPLAEANSFIITAGKRLAHSRVLHFKYMVTACKRLAHNQLLLSNTKHITAPDQRQAHNRLLQSRTYMTTSGRPDQAAI